MSGVEEDRQTSASDPIPQTTPFIALDQVQEVVIPSSGHIIVPVDDGPIRSAAVHFEQLETACTERQTVPNPEAPALDNIILGDGEAKLASDTSSQLAAIDAWLAARPRIAALRNHILTLRVDVKRERIRYSQLEELIESVVDEFLKVLNIAASNGSWMFSREMLEQLQVKIKSCSDDLKRQREKNATLEDGLSNQEYRLTELENEIYQELDREYLSGRHTQPRAGIPINTPATTTISDGDTFNSTRHELYSRMGDLRVLLDRLNDFEFELRQELDERDVLRATGQISLTPEEQFFEDKKTERKQIQDQVEEVRTEVDRLKGHCKSQGIVFEDVQFPEPLYEEVYSEKSAPTSEQLDQTVPEPTPSVQSGSSSVINTFLNKRDRVKRWLGDPHNPAEMGRPITEENEADNLIGALSTTPKVASKEDPIQVPMATLTDIPITSRGVPAHSFEERSDAILSRLPEKALRRRNSD